MGDHGKHTEHEPKQSGGRALSRVQGHRVPCEGSGGFVPLKLKVFCPFSYKKWRKVKDFK